MKMFSGMFRNIWRQDLRVLRRCISTTKTSAYYSYEPVFPIAGRHPKIANAHEAVSAIKSST